MSSFTLRGRCLTSVPGENGARGRTANKSAQALRFESERQYVADTRRLKRTSEIRSHRVDRMYYMNGANVKLEEKYTVEDEALERLKAMFRTSKSARYTSMSIGERRGDRYTPDRTDRFQAPKQPPPTSRDQPDGATQVEKKEEKAEASPEENKGEENAVDKVRTQDEDSESLVPKTDRSQDTKDGDVKKTDEPADPDLEKASLYVHADASEEAQSRTEVHTRPQEVDKTTEEEEIQSEDENEEKPQQWDAGENEAGEDEQNLSMKNNLTADSQFTEETLKTEVSDNQSDIQYPEIEPQKTDNEEDGGDDNDGDGSKNVFITV